MNVPAKNAGEAVVEYRRRHRMNTASQNKMLRSGYIRSENETTKLGVDMIKNTARTRSGIGNSERDTMVTNAQASNCNTTKTWNAAGECVRCFRTLNS